MAQFIKLELCMTGKGKPIVGIIMGSKSDWETLRHADEMLTRFGVPARMPRRLRPPHARLDGRIRPRRRGPRASR